MRYHRTTDCDGRAVISTCRHDSSWVLSFLRCAALPGLMMWYYAFDFAPVKLESVAPMVLGLKRSFFRCYGWRLMLCCIFFIFVLMRVFSTFVGSPKILCADALHGGVR
jgi:hypothetical protein